MQVTVWSESADQAKEAASSIAETLSDDGWRFVSAKSQTDDIGARIITLQFNEK